MAVKGIKGRENLLKVGKAIQFWRKLEGYDQFGFSQELGTVRSYVARLESGHTGISLTRINRISEILGVSIHSILCGLPGKEEAQELLSLYRDEALGISKRELEILFRAGLGGRRVTRDFYLYLLSCVRSGVFTR